MGITKSILSFFLVFFLFQLVLGEAGIISFIQRKYVTERLSHNINFLVDTNTHLTTQEQLSQNNPSYLRMNSHRVGLLAPDEFLIKTVRPIFFEIATYSPGKVILDKKIFFISNFMLFIISVLLVCSSYLVKIFLVSYNTQDMNEHENETLSTIIHAQPSTPPINHIEEELKEKREVLYS